MKRLLAGVLTMVVLSACASPFAKAETPQQALASAAQRAGQLKSAKFDLSGNANMTFPSQLGQAFSHSGSGGSLAVTLSGKGEAQFPDRYHATVNATMGGMSIASEVIVANGKAYVKNPLTNRWEASSQTMNLSGQFGQADPLSYEQLLKNVKTIVDEHDTQLDNTTVHHYRLTPDKDKLLASLDSAAVKNPQAEAALRQILNSGTMTIDVWFGKDDHLVRRISTQADYTIDLNQLMGSLGAPAGAGSSQLPTGSTIHATAQIVINYHDFDQPVTISIPTVG